MSSQRLPDAHSLPGPLMRRPSSQTVALIVAFVGLLSPGQSAGQVLPGDSAAVRALQGAPLLGSIEEELERARQLRGADADGFLLRSLSRRLPSGGDSTFDVRFVAPEIRSSWNSEIPISLNEGTGWSGRGGSAVVAGGVSVRVGPFSAVLVPELAYSQNQDFAIVPREIPNRSEYSLEWFADTMSIDMPVRFGADGREVFSPGQSTVQLSGGPVAIGASTENHWWGPGIRNAIVMSNNARGFPHLFFRTIRPVVTPIGEIETIWLSGMLSGSDYFDPVAPDSTRSLSGFAVTYSPRWQPNLYLGAARTVYRARDPSDGPFGSAADVFLDWSGSNELERDARDDPSEQILSFFGRWIFPSEGLEVYGEWARYRLPLSIGDFLEQPNHSQGYTVGFQWLNAVGREGGVRVQAEVTNLERSASYRLRPIGSYYTSLDVPHGYTHEGKVIGAAIGPGSSSQWIAADYLGAGLRLGIFATRIRWHNDAYYRRTAPWPFFGHDVSLIGGIRGGVDWGHLRFDAELAQGKRHNFLFQNWGAGWENMDDAVDISNRSLNLRVSVLN